ncbi:MAG: hypothetical protein SPK52_02175 [Synergistales bacterium]|nr:hypothetical protein [Bacteroidales bacterium]MDY6435004.1 hypothetical protein [Synergistales bacterium]MDY6393425.1 hypothetical protein [Bacteroidales bacterium]MDY6395360.1 hypothetical protein [Bacteroidales bacterium]MDY6402870.1 hypothetical protein [Bacteroidales bacterium]
MAGILLDEDRDIKVISGCLVIGDNTLDMIENIIDSNKGEWKDNIYLGVGIKKMIAQSSDDKSIGNEVVENLRRGKIEYTSVSVKNGKIDIEI